MKLKSEMMSGILTILLGVLVLFSALNLVGTIIYAIDFNFYLNNVYSFDGFVDLLAVWLYYIIVLLHPIWIYRVHMDLNVRFLRYPRSPGVALACMIIPFYSFYGIPSTYSIIGNHYRNETIVACKQGIWISRLAAPLLICVFASHGFNRAIVAQADPSDALLLAGDAIELVTYAIFLSLCILVSRGIKLMLIYVDEIPQQNEGMENDSVTNMNLES